MRRLLPLFAALAAVVPAPGAAMAADPGPALTEPVAVRMAALACAGDLRASARAPVLLVHGTGANSVENWRWGYRKVLLDRGHAVCTVDLPHRGRMDLQRGVEYVVTAIREVHRRAGRKLAVIGHSQGALQPAFALRVWPDLAAMVDDFFGIAGVYDRGTTTARDSCADGLCPATSWQFAAGSRFNAALARRKLPAGPSYTAVGTLAEDTVKPQPYANGIPGMTRYQIQDLCPGRRFALDHIYQAADAAMHAFAIDALDHPGPAVLGRIPKLPACALPVFLGADVADLALLLPQIFAAQSEPTAQLRAEPPLRCYLVGTCEARSGAVALIAASRLATRRVRPGGRGRLVLRAHAAGRVRVRVDRRRPARSVRLRRGRQVIRFRVRGLRPGRHRVAVETRAPGARVFTRERTHRFRVTGR